MLFKREAICIMKPAEQPFLSSYLSWLQSLEKMIWSQNQGTHTDKSGTGTPAGLKTSMATRLEAPVWCELPAMPWLQNTSCSILIQHSCTTAGLCGATVQGWAFGMSTISGCSSLLVDSISSGWHLVSHIHFLGAALCGPDWKHTV